MQVSVDVLNARGRIEIVKVHASNKKFDSDGLLKVVEMRIPGFSGAYVVNLLNEAMILVGKREKKTISSKEIDDYIDRIIIGRDRAIMTRGKNERTHHLVIELLIIKHLIMKALLQYSCCAHI
jgi:cell division protease FtsH